jgi:hypothetical protein
MHKSLLRGVSGVVGFSATAARQRFIRRFTSIAFACCVALAAWIPSSLANPINYGDFMGTSVTWVDVTEASATDNLPLFDMPTPAGDSLNFDPIGFSASATGLAPPIDLTDGQLLFMVVAKPGKAIANIKFAESGVTTVTGVGTDLTYTDVSAEGMLEINEVDGNPIDVIDVPISLIFSHRADGQWQLVTDGEALTLPWTGMQFIDLNAILDANNIPYDLGVTKLSVDLDNALIARSEQGSLAFIDKKDYFIVTVNVPEPATLMLLGLALIASLASFRSR